MTAAAPALREHGNSYNIFILVLTIFSLAIMVLLLLPVSDGRAGSTHPLRQRHLHRLPHRFRLNLTGSKPKRAYFIGRARLARPARVHPDFGLHPVHGAVPAGPAQPADPDHPAAARPGRQGPHHRRPRRTAASTRRSSRSCSRASSSRPRACWSWSSRAGTRGEHPDRRRCHLVGAGDDHDRRVWRLLPDHDPRADHRPVRDGRGHRDHRRPREHPREPPGRTVVGGRRSSQVPPPTRPATTDSVADRNGAGRHRPGTGRPAGGGGWPAGRDRRPPSVARKPGQSAGSRLTADPATRIPPSTCRQRDLRPGSTPRRSSGGSP